MTYELRVTEYLYRGYWITIRVRLYRRLHADN